jgi:hypothetical protein
MALRIVLIAAPFCILAILAVIDFFLRRGGGPGLGSSAAIKSHGLLPSRAGQPQHSARPLGGHQGEVAHRGRYLPRERGVVSSRGPVSHRLAKGKA